jgi:hypothetical protein
MLQPARQPEITYASKEEKVCSDLLVRFLDWKPVLGKTYQYPISAKHDADFYLPAQNLILEFHPTIVKYYGAAGVFKRLMRLQEQLSKREYLEVEDIVCQQINHEYFKRRRAIMDLSDNVEVRKMRLVVAADYSELYQQVIRPYARDKITHTKFKDTLDLLRRK